MNNATLHRQVSLIPLTVLNAVVQANNGTPCEDKGAAIDYVVRLISLGLITLDQAKGTVPRGGNAPKKASAPQPATEVPEIDIRISEQILAQAREITRLRD